MFKYYSSYALVFSNFTHLLCCGLPTIIGLSSLLTNFMFIEVFISNIEAFEVFEVYFFCLTTFIFAVFISIEVYNKKVRCVSDDVCCTKYECDSSKNKIKFNLIISSILYTVNSFFFLSEFLF